MELASELPWPALAYMGLGTTALTLWIEMSALKQVMGAQLPCTRTLFWFVLCTMAPPLP